MILNVKTKPDLPDLFPGEMYHRTHQQSVDSILLPLHVKRFVHSEGSSFYNQDTWYGLWFANNLAKWAMRNPQKGTPTQTEIMQIIGEGDAMARKHSEKKIVIARTPEKLNHRLAGALIGGAYHEAWHTKYSRRTPLRKEEILPLLEDWDLIPDWSQVASMFQQLCHWIEDIRIERLGCLEYPGAKMPMCDLADFILDMEMGGDQRNQMDPNDPDFQRGIFLCCMRDLGLGYSTQATRSALDFYQKKAPHITDLFRKGGPLYDLLEEAKNLRYDDMGFMRVAIKISVVLYDLSKGNPAPQPQPQQGSGQGSDSQEGEPQESASSGEGSPQDGEEEQSGQGPGEGQDEGDGQGDGKEDDESQGQGQGEGQEEGESPEGDGQGQGDGKEDQNGQGQEGQGREGEKEEGEDEGDQGGKGGRADDSSRSDSDASGNGAGGFQSAAEDILNGDEQKSQPLNHASALEEGFEDTHEEELKQLQTGEASWNPVSTTEDKAMVVRQMSNDQVQRMLQKVQREVSALRARLRLIVRAQEMTDVEHGARRGRQLSARTLVDSRVTLMAGREPTRAYQMESESIDTSLALALCIDESSSMKGLLDRVRESVLIFLEPIENIGGASFAFGFRNGDDYRGPGRGGPRYHRSQAITYDIFKGWNERFANVKGRFAYTKAKGGTPMADGVQYGLSALNMRNEGHRILAVLTDGDPDTGHAPVIRGQIRKAREAGIHVLGIGVTPHSRNVKTLFPDHVYCKDVSELPQKLIVKLNEICDFSGRNRGRRMNLRKPL